MTGRRLALAALAAALGAWLRFGPAATPAPTGAEPSAPAAAADLAEARAAAAAPSPPAAFAAIEERPLFHPSRRPPEPPPPPPDAPPPEPEPPPGPVDLSGYRLVGVVISGADRIAVVRTPEEERLELRRGDMLDLWTVAEITPVAVTFEAEGETGALPLDPEP